MTRIAALRVRRALFWSLVLAGVAGLYRFAFLPARAPEPRARTADVAKDEATTLVVTSKQQAGAAPPTNAAPDPMLSGRVQTVSGVALAGATVCAADASAKPNELTACALSDANGRFTLQELSASALTLFASRAGYLPLEQTTPARARGVPIVLVMQEGGARVTGSVVDALGGPIAGARLFARSLRDQKQVLGVSDAAGRFQLDVAPGEHEVSCGATGYAQHRLLVLAPSDGITFVLAAGSAIIGRVLEQGSRAPVANLGVSVRSVVDALGVERSERTREDGTFVVNDLPPGAYSLQVVSEHWRSDERQVPLGFSEVSEPVELLARQATRVRGAILVDGAPCDKGWAELRGAVRTQSSLDGQGHFVFDGVPRGHYEITLDCEGALARTEPIEVGLDRGARIWTLERGLQVKGLALTPAGKPASGVSVEIYAVGERAERAGTRCTTDERGEFSCRGLAVGDYDCTIAPGTPSRSDTVRVAVTAESSPRVTLRMHAEAAIHVRIVVDEKVDRLALVLLAKRRDGAISVAERRGELFVFEPLALGSYEVALESGLAEQSRRVELTREGQIAELSLTFPGPHTLSGRVVDDRGVGVPDAWVRASGVSAYGRLGAPVLTNATGDFSLKGLIPGKYRLEASSARGQGELDEIASGSSGALVRLLSFVATAASDSHSDNGGVGR
jgi:hypothetical protein